ncbi:MAG: lipopolysaccharide heptosyltransferase II [Verrucomicrobiota bacterium]|nr:lipopolysaccharide heptosyltransferase II [Verrucomicrobiota bacterium]
MMDRITFFFYKLAVTAIEALPIETVFCFGRLLGRLFGVLLFPYRHLVIRNLTLALGDHKSPEEIRELARQHFATLGANLLSGVKIASMSRYEIEQLVTIENRAALDARLGDGRKVIIAIAHLSNWELFAQLPGMYRDARQASIYQPLRNPLIDEHVRVSRGRFGIEMFGRSEGFAVPIKWLRAGGVIGVLVDQHAGDSGVWTPLFDRLASTSPLTAMLALRTGATVLPAAVYTSGEARWRVVFSDPIEPASYGDANALTAELNQVLERQIRAAPEDWFWVHDRWKTPSPNFLLAGYKRGVAFPRGYHRERLKPFSIVVRSSNWLGDAVMTAPAVAAIKQGRPDARVTILAPAKLADFWKIAPGVDDVIAIEPNEGAIAASRKLAGKFQAAVLFPNSIRVALEVFLARVPRRVGYEGKWRAALLNQIVPEKLHRGPPIHQSQRYLAIARSIGAVIDAEPGLDSLERSSPSLLARIGICPGAEYGPAKRWPAERFAATAAEISAAKGCEWMIFGTESDRPLGVEIERALSGPCTNLIGRTSLAELIVQLQKCDLLLTNDTGTMHLAAFLGVSTLAIFGSTEPALTAPIGPRVQVIRHHVECSPCFLRKCPIDFRCMKEVMPNEVAAAALHLLGSR